MEDASSDFRILWSHKDIPTKKSEGLSVFITINLRFFSVLQNSFSGGEVFSGVSSMEIGNIGCLLLSCFASSFDRVVCDFF